MTKAEYVLVTIAVIAGIGWLLIWWRAPECPDGQRWFLKLSFAYTCEAPSGDNDPLGPV